MVFQLDTGARAEVVCRSLLDGDHAFKIIGGVSMNALETEHSNLEIDSCLDNERLSPPYSGAEICFFPRGGILFKQTFRHLEFYQS